MEQVSAHVYIDPNDGSATVGATKTSAGVVLIDTPNQPTRAMCWREAIRGLGEVRYLINTEHHIDHIFGNFFFPGTVVAHRDTKERFWKDSALGPNPLKNPTQYIQRIDPGGVSHVAGYRAREPEITFDGKLILSLGDVTLELFGMPGHVPVDTAVYVREDRLLFTSDNIFNDTMTWYHEALPFHWLETLERFKGLDVKVVVPGHGRAGGPELFDMMRRVLEGEIGEVRAAVEAGLSREEVTEKISFLARRPVPELHRARAPELQRIFVGHLYDRIKERAAGVGSGHA